MHIEQICLHKWTEKINNSGIQIRVHTGNIFLIYQLKQCCGYSKEPSQLRPFFEHPKQIY